MKPYVVSSVIDKEGTLIKEVKPEVVRKVISTETSDIIRQDLKTVIETGTGKKARIEGYEIGGKTGTAQQGKERDQKSLSFIGFLTVDNPEYVALVLIDKPQIDAQGSTSAAPIFKDLMEKIITYQGTTQSYESENILKDKEQKTITMDDYTNETVISAASKLNDLGLLVSISGKGNIVSGQTINPGTGVPEGAEVTLYVAMGDDGVDAVQVPDITDMPFENACDMLLKYGFEATFEGDNDGVVLSQEPKGGTFAENGSQVLMHIGKAPKTDVAAEGI